MNRAYPEVARRAAHRCEYCRAPEVIFNFPFEVEHILPRCCGGSDGSDNLALACRSCNIWKGDCIEAPTWRNPDEMFRLFNPRLDSWDDHFEADSIGWIKGKTFTGEATEARLRMNHWMAREAREQWLKLGLYP